MFACRYIRAVLNEPVFSAGNKNLLSCGYKQLRPCMQTLFWFRFGTRPLLMFASELIAFACSWVGVLLVVRRTSVVAGTYIHCAW